MKDGRRYSGHGESGKGQAVQMEWLGLKELTEYASLSERTLRFWIYSPVDPLPAVKVRGKWLVRKSDFDHYLERHRFKLLETVDVDGIVGDILEGADDGR